MFPRFPIYVLAIELVLIVIVFFILGPAEALMATPGIALTVIFFYFAAKNKQHATFVDQDTIEFIVKGGTLADVLENIDGWHYQAKAGYLKTRKADLDSKRNVKRNPDGTIILYDDVEKVTEALVEDGEIAITLPNGSSQSYPNEDQKYRPLADSLGFYWVSPFYPQWKIHQFLVPHLRIKPETDIRDEDSLEKALDNSVRNPAKDAQGKDIPGTTWETSLLWKFPRPVLVRDAEFSDLYRADILLEVICQIIKPRALVFTYRERFFPNVERAVQAATIDYLRRFEGGYDGFIKEGVTGSQSPFYWEALNPLNFGTRGLIQEFGVYIIDARVVYTKLAKIHTEAQEALLAEKVAIAKGKGVMAEADAKAKAITTVGTAEANMLKMQLDKSSEAILIEKLRKEALVGNEHVTHLVERGAVQINK